MKFTRAQIIVHEPVDGPPDASGNPTTTAVITQEPLSDLILGDGTAHTVRKRTKEFGVSRESDSITSEIITTASFLDIVQPINGNNQVFLMVHVVALGASTGLDVRIEFNDPDHPEFWLPSKEAINRESNADTHTWVLTAAGDYLLASRVEHHHFRKFRARFRARGADADATTQIVVTWYHNGKISDMEYEVNSPNAPTV